MIVVVSHGEDPHAARVIEHLARDGHAPLLLNLAELPNQATLSFIYGPGAEVELAYRRASGESFALDQASSVWWRRPQAPLPDSVTDPDLRQFVSNEWHEATSGLWRLMTRARWMNDPVRDEVASRKALQLQVAQQVGLRVPRTVITSDPQVARRFIEMQGVSRTVYKTFSCTHAVWRETRLLRDDDLALLDSLRIAPVIFQEFVPAGADLRITVVGAELFAAAIRPEAGDSRVDFRMRVGRSSMRAHELPARIAGQLHALMDRLGLVYGAIDMRTTPDGDYVFLEINTAGEFLFVEERTGLPITRALAGWLAKA